MKIKLLLLNFLLILFFSSCHKKTAKKTKHNHVDSAVQHKENKQTSTIKFHELSLTNAEKLAELPLTCLQKEYPNKPSEVLHSVDDIQSPQEMHPTFYGCFDWHSSVHGHWSLVYLLKHFPKMTQTDSIRQKLLQNLTKENILKETDYFKNNQTFERTYGWAWLLKLAAELHTWDDTIAKTLETNLQPLTDEIVLHYKDFLPKLTNPIRVGQHENTAFGLVFAYDYAVRVGDKELKNLIVDRAKEFYLKDKSCPVNYEPDGFDFLSPCLEEVDIMSRVLPEPEFISWLNDFMPQLMNPKYKLNPGEVTDREDGKLVHLDGLNFSRAWVFYDLAKKYQSLSHLKAVGDIQFNASFGHTIDDKSYMGSHWLGSFALYAMNRR